MGYWREVKFAKRTAQAFACTVVLTLLLSGSVFAYSTRLSHISSLASPSPLDDDKSSSTTTEHEDKSSTTRSTEHGDKSSTTITTTEQEDKSSTTRSTEHEDKSSTTITTTEHEDKSSTTTTVHDKNEVNEETQTAENKGESTLEFKLVPVGTAAGKGDAEVQIGGTDIRVDLQIEHAPANGTYSVALITSQTSPIFTVSSAACSASIGTLITSDEGQAEVKLKTSLSPGTYFVGLIVCTGGTPSLISDPLTLSGTITQGKAENEKEQTNEVNAKEEAKTDEDDINKAKDSKQIPAVVEVSGSGSTITQIDSKFSVSVSRPSDNSLSVSIAGANGTGPRVLLIDISKDAGGLSSLGSLKVTYDGERVSQASSLSQVLSGTSTSPPSYIVLLTSSGAHLLVFIPHFSSHLIELLAGFVSFDALTAEAPLMLGGLAVFAAISAVKYAARKKFVTSESR